MLKVKLVKLLTLKWQRSNLVGIVKSRFSVAEDARRSDEARWLKAYENYRGLYNKSIKLETLKSLVSL